MTDTDEVSPLPIYIERAERLLENADLPTREIVATSSR
jgi:hypothetical protein